MGVKDNQGTLTFRVGLSAPFSMLAKAYCSHRGLQPGSMVRFMIDDNPVPDWSGTVEMLALKDGVITVSTFFDATSNSLSEEAGDVSILSSGMWLVAPY